MGWQAGSRGWQQVLAAGTGSRDWQQILSEELAAWAVSRGWQQSLFECWLGYARYLQQVQLHPIFLLLVDFYP